MKNIMLTLIIFSLIVSCTQDEQYRVKEVKSFPINQELVHEIVELDTVPGCPNELLLAGDYLVLINDGDCNEIIFHIYDKESFLLLGSFGAIGRGPNELFYPRLTNQVVYNDTLRGFWILNQKNKRFELVNIEKSLKSKQYVYEENHYRIEGGGSKSYRIDDENVIVNSLNEKKGRFHIYNLKNDSTQWFGFFPLLNFTDSPQFSEPLEEVFVSRNALSKDGEFFVSALLLAKRIDIFNNQLDHQVSIKYEDSPENIKLPAKEEDWHNIYGYFAPFNIFLDKNNLIYVVMQEVSLSGRVKDNKAEVHVFSIQGEAKARYILDTHQWIEHFTIDEDNNNLFCMVHTDEGYPEIISYQLPEM